MRRTHLVVAGVTVAALVASVQLTGANAASKVAASKHQDPNQSLRVLGERHDLAIGTAIDMNALANDATYRARAATEFSSVTAENVMKPETTMPARGVFNFTRADQLIAFAEANGQKVRGHVLLWHSQNPRWLTQGVANGTISDAELRAIFREYVTTVVSHFKGRIWQWDVANEIFDDSPTPQWRQSIWVQRLGQGIVAEAFRLAHAADKDAKLFINDYSVENINAKSTAYYNLLREYKAQGVPIDGFGAQGHLSTDYNAPSRMQENLQRFNDLGLDTAITEADVRSTIPTGTATAKDLQASAAQYDVMLKACLMTRRCISFTLWGFTDRYSWVPSTFRGEGAANVLDANYNAKPAYNALRTTLAISDGPHNRD